MTCTLEDILKSRDRRNFQRQNLLMTYGGLAVTLQLNIPGANKDKDIYRKTLLSCYQEVKSMFDNKGIPINYDKVQFFITGPEAILIVDSRVPHLKELMIHIEETHPLGRLFDIDVFNHNGEPYSRTCLKKTPRSCYICGESAKVCARSRKHEVSEIIKCIDLMMTDYHF